MTDTGSATSGQGSWVVGNAAAENCITTQAPATVAAGSVLGMTVAVRDHFGNVAKDYSGTVQLTSSDARAALPGNVVYVPAVDAGSHAFSASLITAGPQS